PRTPPWPLPPAEPAHSPPSSHDRSTLPSRTSLVICVKCYLFIRLWRGPPPDNGRELDDESTPADLRRSTGTGPRNDVRLGTDRNDTGSRGDHGHRARSVRRTRRGRQQPG